MKQYEKCNECSAKGYITGDYGESYLCLWCDGTGRKEVKETPGRPKGSKNKPKKHVHQFQFVSVEDAGDGSWSDPFHDLYKFICICGKVKYVLEK